jgi:uncharacterized protein DUF6714
MGLRSIAPSESSARQTAAKGLRRSIISSPVGTAYKEAIGKRPDSGISATTKEGNSTPWLSKSAANIPRRHIISTPPNSGKQIRKRLVNDDLEKEIRESFEDVPKPQGKDIAPHSCAECDNIRRSLEPHPFDKVPDDIIYSLIDSLPLLGPKGLHYFLPTFLLFVIRNPKVAGGDYLLYHLAPSKKQLSSGGEYWERLAVFSPRQRKSILSFVEWLAGTKVGSEYPKDIKRALESGLIR